MVESRPRENSWDSIVKIHVKIITVSNRMIAEKMERTECKQDTILAVDKIGFSDWHGVMKKKGTKTTPWFWFKYAQIWASPMAQW